MEPKISICASCYNHEKYIPYFMETLLKQDFQDWECIITDDCSTDSSWEVLQQYAADPRVRLYKNARNSHVCATINNSYWQAKGKYICDMSTDDAFVEGRLRHDFEFLESHPDIAVLYNDILPINEANEVIGQPWQQPTPFSRYELLHFLMVERNCLLIPGITFKRECLQTVIGNNPLICFTQDYELHIKLLLNYEAARSGKALTYYRRRDDEANLAVETPEVMRAVLSETAMFMRDCLKQIKDTKQFKAIFPEFNRYENLVDEDVVFYASLCLLDSPSPAIRCAGLMSLYDFVITHGDRLEERYDFRAIDFMALSRIAQPIPCNATLQDLVDESKINSIGKRGLYNIWMSIARKLRRRHILKG